MKNKIANLLTNKHVLGSIVVIFSSIAGFVVYNLGNAIGEYDGYNEGIEDCIRLARELNNKEKTNEEETS